MGHTRRNRQTGTLVTVAHGDEVGLEVSRDFGIVWYTICEPDSRIVGHLTKEIAMFHAAGPLGWCGVCRSEHGTVDVRRRRGVEQGCVE